MSQVGDLKGLILAGGKGTRLRPITFTRAKQLIPVANKPILYYGLDALAEAGVKDVGIVIGETGAEIREAVGDGSPWGLRVEYLLQPEPLGLAHAVLIAEEFLGKSPFIMYLGDNIIKEGVRRFADQFRKERPNALILLSKVRDPQRFGVAELSGGRVVHLVEKPAAPKSDLALVGVYIFDSTIFDAIHSIQPSARGEFEITDAIQYQIDHNRHVAAFTITGWWKDTGKLEDLLEANQILLNDIPRRIDGTVDAESRVDGRVIIERGATIAKSTIRGPATIGSGSLIEDSFVGPYTSISNRVTISASEIENSIVLEGARIHDAGGRIESSLIGTHVVIKRNTGQPRTHKFVLGDSSEVDLV